MYSMRDDSYVECRRIEIFKLKFYFLTWIEKKNYTTTRIREGENVLSH
jgi:hypothetical protein